jgi:hypothetical protein
MIDDDVADTFNLEWALKIIKDIEKYPPGKEYKEIRGLAWVTAKRISEAHREIKPKFYFA